MPVKECSINRLLAYRRWVNSITFLINLPLGNWETLAKYLNNMALRYHQFRNFQWPFQNWVSWCKAQRWKIKQWTCYFLQRICIKTKVQSTVTYTYYICFNFLRLNVTANEVKNNCKARVIKFEFSIFKWPLIACFFLFLIWNHDTYLIMLNNFNKGKNN